jgi:hypothetical protein
MSDRVTQTDAVLGPPPQRPGRRSGALSDVLAVLGSMLVLGLVCGLLWWLVVNPAEFTKMRAGGAMGEVQLGRRFDADGWYVVLGLLGGLAAGVALMWWRSRDALLTTGLLVAGAVLAAAVTAVVGHLLGPSDPQGRLEAARIGARVPTQLAVDAWTAYLAWPIGALAGALLVLWSKPLEPEL